MRQTDRRRIDPKRGEAGWTRPELKRFQAGAAESASGPVDDGPENVIS